MLRQAFGSKFFQQQNSAASIATLTKLTTQFHTIPVVWRGPNFGVPTPSSSQQSYWQSQLFPKTECICPNHFSMDRVHSSRLGTCQLKANTSFGSRLFGHTQHAPFGSTISFGAWSQQTNPKDSLQILLSRNSIKREGPQMSGRPSMELSNLPLLFYIVLAYPAKSVFREAKRHKKDGSKRRRFAHRTAATVPFS